MSRSARPGAAVLAAAALASLGLVFLLGGLWIPAKAWLAQRLIASAWEETRATGRTARPWSWADTWPVARLAAPGHAESLFVLAGASGQSLAFGPAHVSQSAAPGSEDNVAIAGHRDTHFAFLRDLEVGDELVLESQIERRFETRRYRVVATQVVHESRTDLLERSGRPELTLITCYPFGALVPGGPLRYVVHAEAAPDPDVAQHEESSTTPRASLARFETSGAYAE